MNSNFYRCGFDAKPEQHTPMPSTVCYRFQARFVPLDEQVGAAATNPLWLQRALYPEHFPLPSGDLSNALSVGPHALHNRVVGSCRCCGIA